ncbi:MAG TPA: hypothetical protein VKX25_21355 [Bryobacteraceae bacterium]|jgi:hypothetical protein|nr:hypothetical protein [Bryobacteraceae bacterium]
MLPRRPALKRFPVDVKLDIEHTAGGRIAEDFLGLGYETSSIAAGVPSGADRPYVGLVKKLARSGVIRVGGNTSDDAFFQAAATAISKPKGSVVNRANLDQLAAFLDATGWRLIWGLNLGSGSAAEAAREAQAVAQAVRDKLLAFEIGNEPDLFGRGTHHRRDGYSYEDYLGEYRAYKTAIRREVPNAPFAGPDAASATDWVTRFAEDEGRDLKLLTHHYYRECAGDTSTIEKLLSADPKLKPELSRLQAASKAAGVPYRICEVNSFCGGGKAGVSDTLASALWVLDYMFTLAAFDASGLNLETGVNQLGWMSWYSPIVTDDRQAVSTRPDYTGMLAFAPSLGGERLSIDYAANGANLNVYAVKKGESIVMTLVNKDSRRDGVVTIASKQRLRPRALLRLTGPSLASKEDVNLRGDGAPDSLDLIVPSGSAAILTSYLVGAR